MIAFPKKVSWILLTLYFIFDNVISYWAVTRMGGRELNTIIAPLVETYPRLYFLCIPAELIGAYLLVLLLRKWIDERVVLTGGVLYWLIANSSMNILYILGIHGLGYLWLPFTLVGVFVSGGYLLFAILRES